MMRFPVTMHRLLVAAVVVFAVLSRHSSPSITIPLFPRVAARQPWHVPFAHSVPIGSRSPRLSSPPCWSFSD
jgi:hypothetical protein